MAGYNEDEPSVKLYRPWNRLDLLARIHTFTSCSWSLLNINPVLCALHGWTASDSERLTCLLCGISFSCSMQNNIRDALIKKYKEMLVGEHKESCAWKIKACDSNLYSSQFNRSEGLEQRNRANADFVFAGITGEVLAEKGWNKCANDLIKCEECGRSVGLWNFDDKAFDLLMEHKPFCNFRK